MSFPGLDLTGRTAVVIGATSGLGKAIALGLADAGADVVPTGRRRELAAEAAREVEARGRRSLVIAADVSDTRSIQELADTVVERFGKVDILVNNAGVTWAAEPEDLPLDKWQKVVDINLTGAFLFSQAAARDMLTRQWGY